ncbi:hypothetical protein Y032_0037g3362, partial [Ancylostoma ceylanicum]
MIHEGGFCYGTMANHERCDCEQSQYSMGSTTCGEGTRTDYVHHPQCQCGLNRNRRTEPTEDGDATPPYIGGRPVWHFRRQEHQAACAPSLPFLPLSFYPSGDMNNNSIWVRPRYPNFTVPYLPNFATSHQRNVSSPTNFTVDGIMGETDNSSPSSSGQPTEANTAAQPTVVVKEEPPDDVDDPPPPKRIRGFTINEILEIDDDPQDQ